MTETEPVIPGTEAHAAHVDGIAYSRDDDETTVDYPADPEATFRSWFSTGITAVGLFTMSVALAAALCIWKAPDSSNVSAGPTIPKVTLTPPPVTLQEPPAPPPAVLPSPPPVQHVNSPDTVFAESWNSQMPAYPFPDQFCVDSSVKPGCWFHLDNTDPNDVEFIFLGRARCEYIRAHPGPLALPAAARDVRYMYHDFTVDQSNEIVTLAIRAYCPQYQ
jgi:hypothetical protein